MKNMRIGPRLLIGFGILVALCIATGVYALAKQQALHNVTEQMYQRDFSVLDSLRGINRSEDQMRGTRELVLLSAILRKDRMQGGGDPAVLERQWNAFRDQNLKLLTDLETAIAGWEASALTGEREVAWNKVHTAARAAHDALLAITPEVEQQFALVNQERLAEAWALTPAVERVAAAYQDKLGDAQQAVQDLIQLGRSETAAIADQTQTSVVVVIIASVLAGIFLAVIVQRSIISPLREFMIVVDKVGQGDLTVKADASRGDELGDLGRGINRMVGGLREVALQTRSVAENLNAATAEILASTQQQAAGTAEQAAAVQQANATMAELAQSGAQISDRAKQVAASAEATTSASASGAQSVQNTVSIMESIREQAEAVAENVIALSEKTQAVGEIIASVNEIAEQSHLLALNASIQAAAAGEHGRSFSVVAGEMKNLAGQSKQATVQVRSILGDIQKSITSSVMLTEEAVKRVESGRQQADVAERAITELTGNIEESVRAFQQIVGGSSQQQIGFEQVTQAFRSIGVASQETANSTKQSEKAAANLSALAQQLRGAVERYRL
jgi:methyl-accepting chemotaxis protein